MSTTPNPLPVLYCEAQDAYLVPDDPADAYIEQATGPHAIEGCTCTDGRCWDQAQVAAEVGAQREYEATLWRADDPEWALPIDPDTQLPYAPAPPPRKPLPACPGCGTPLYPEAGAQYCADCQAPQLVVKIIADMQGELYAVAAATTAFLAQFSLTRANLLSSHVNFVGETQDFTAAYVLTLVLEVPAHIARQIAGEGK